MSLHLGNLSSRIRRDELERVFRRFGMCTIRVKEGYGFAVYNYPANAEKALKALEGKRICGEPITLSWSKQQPRAMQRSIRGGNSPARRRYSKRENYDQRLGSDAPQDHKMDFRTTVSEDKNFGSSAVVNGAMSYNANDEKHFAGEKDRDALDNFHEVGGVQRNHMGDDRWEELVVNPSNENGLADALVFDRYEPYHSDEKKEQDEEDQNHLSGSSARRSQERAGNRKNDSKGTLGYPNNQKSRKGCYICGEVGHKMNTCPLKTKRLATDLQGRLRPAHDDDLTRRQKSIREVSSSRNHWRLRRSAVSPIEKGATRDRKKDIRGSKRNKRDHDNFERHRSKKARGPSLSSVHSDYTASRSQSPLRSSRSLSRSLSHSDLKLVPSEKSSPSSCSRSKSHYSGSKSAKSGLRSRSSSPISIQAVSSNPLASSPNKMHMGHSTSVVNAADPVYNEDLLEREKLQQSGVDNSRYENILSATENEFAAGPSNLEEEKEMYISRRDDAPNQLFSRGSCEVSESHIAKSSSGDRTADDLLLSSQKETPEPPSESFTAEHEVQQEFDVSMSSNVANSMRMSTEEIYMVLKHYGLDQLEEKEKNLSVEAYFGSARLWPWEIIYYRRLKKGPISTENYARRVAENEEFGIVDKYIRSSSGWGQLSEDN